VAQDLELVRRVEIDLDHLILCRRLDADAFALERDVLDARILIDDDGRLVAGAERLERRLRFRRRRRFPPVAGVDEDALEVLCGKVVLGLGRGLSAAGTARNADEAGGIVSLRRSSASNALPQRPQRTVPRPARSMSAVTRKRVWQSGHWEYIGPVLGSGQSARRRPASKAQPSRIAAVPISNHGR
jgi:hypothetical protein